MASWGGWCPGTGRPFPPLLMSVCLYCGTRRSSLDKGRGEKMERSCQEPMPGRVSAPATPLGERQRSLAEWPLFLPERLKLDS